MIPIPSSKQCLLCELLHNTALNETVCRLEFRWAGSIPRAGQFFMIRPERTSVFLGRPISAAGWNSGASSPSVHFLIAKRGRGTEELTRINPGERAELIGPLGNAWGDLLPNEGPIALVGGGAGVAPMTAFAGELGDRAYDFYGGFKSASFGLESVHPLSLIIAGEDGSAGRRGRISDFLEPAKYRAVYACGPEPMLKAVAGSCNKAGVPCFVSLERRMACGVGACLGCTIKTVWGSRRCCADGPIFNAAEVIFDE
ncbi:MAG: dihydroorotate dehydrogenase electron transfer subunit [Treponema sp.]|nr:dihydroorotate dehydrogenase electron transfer subunit [Treponema sp.]